MADAALPEHLDASGLESVARRFRALGEPQRLRILRELMAGERSVGDLVDASGVGQATVSKHLGILRAEGLVEFRRDGTRKLYRIADPVVPRLCSLMCEALENRTIRHLRALRGAEV